MGACRVRLAVVNQTEEGGATAAAREILAWGPERGFEVRYFPESPAESGRELLARLDRFDPQIVHVHCWYNLYPFGLIVDLGERWPVVFTVHDVAVVNQYGTECWECYRNPFCFGCPALGPLRRFRPNYRIRDRLRKRRTVRRARCHLVWPSEWIRRRLGRSEWSRHPGAVIPYGVDVAYFASGRREPASFGLPVGKVVLFTGNMYSEEDHRKGLPDLLEAWPTVRRAEPRAVLAIAGRVPARALPEGAVLLGEVPRARLPDLYASAEILCMPSRGDNLPLAVLEAMAAGLPVAGTHVGGIPEEVSDGETGLLVPAAKPAELARVLTLLLSDGALRQRLGAAGRERAQVCFSRDLCAERHDALYRRFLGSSRDVR
jgi:glycosyltransferase involved in cell wall biosynthesis